MLSRKSAQSRYGRLRQAALEYHHHPLSGKNEFHLPLSSCHTSTVCVWGYLFHSSCYLLQYVYEQGKPHSRSSPPFNTWSLTVCKYGGGSLGRFHHVQCCQVDTWGTVSNHLQNFVLISREYTACECFTLQSWESHLQGRASRFCLPDIIKCEKISQALIPIQYLQWRKEDSSVDCTRISQQPQPQPYA